MRLRIKSLWSGPLALCVAMIGSATSAQNQHPIHNVFFGFEFVLQPLAIKWACGGKRDQDLSQIETLVVAFPEYAERAELRPIVAMLSELASGRESVPELFGPELSSEQVEQLCAAALPLNIDWLTPEQLITDDESGVPEEQQAALTNFYGVVEGLQ